MRHQYLPDNVTGNDAFLFAKQNKAKIKALKKAEKKIADAVCYSNYLIGKDGSIDKADNTGIDEGMIKVTPVINSCYWYDSHGDVHIPGIWNKSLSDNSKRAANGIFHLQEHSMKFQNIIAEYGDVNPYVRSVSWRELGVEFDGATECLCFDSTVRKEVNQYMFDLYSKKRVKNHSVGMYYVNIDLAVNFDSKDFEEEYALWKKYIDFIPNADEAKEDGMFWAVTEAKVIEGSSVVIGSNTITPTLNDKSTFIEPEIPTQTEPPKNKSWFSLIQ